jgi:hypothetical protein
VNGSVPCVPAEELEAPDVQSWGLYAWQVELLDATAALGAIKAMTTTNEAMRFISPFS